jgi:hypothetical protein
MPDFCLVLACQLHQAGQTPVYSEAAVGMLLASPGVPGRYRGELRPQAYVFQPVSSATDSVADALRDMVDAQQAPPERIGHLWLTSLPRQGNHATVAAASACGLKVAAHDVDMAIGLPGPANAWLAQALAAEMVQHGQGTQIVATPRGAGVLLNMTGTHGVPVPDVRDSRPRYLGTFAVIGHASFCILLGLLAYTLQAPDDVYRILVVLLMVLIFIEVFVGWRRYRDIEDAFEGRT